MKYIINLNVIFDPEHRILTLNNNNQTSLELSKPACRVLNELIQKNGNTSSRDSLLKNAWEDYGFPPSNAGLNNCISELRKSFVRLGIEKPIIITLPKVGFRMEADIHPTPKQKTDTKINKIEQVATKPETVMALKEKISVDTIPLATPDEWTKKNMAIPILTLVAVLGIIGMALLLWGSSTQLKLIDTYKKCDIYSIRKEPIAGSELRVKQMLESEKLDCDMVQQDIFYTEERPDNDLLKITFMAACKAGQTGSDYQYCKTFKIIE